MSNKLPLKSLIKSFRTHVILIISTILLFINLSYAGPDNEASSEDVVEQNDNNNYHYILSISNYSHADLTWSLLEGHRQLDDYLFSTNDNLTINALSYATRIVFNSFITILNHELGHAFTAKRFGANIKDIHVTPFEGHVSFNGISTNEYYKHNIISTSGMQASHTLGKKIAKSNIMHGYTNPNHGIAYAFTAGDQPGYILFSKNSKGNDVSSYIKDVNNLYETKAVSKARLKKLAIFDLVDPLMYTSLYSFFANDNTPVYMLNFNAPIADGIEIGYLPATRLTLAPYGPEVNFVNHIKIQDKYARIAFGYGKTKSLKTYSFDAEFDNIIQVSLGGDTSSSIGGRFMIWSQPKDLHKTPVSPPKSKKNGGLASLEFKTKFQNQLSLITALGFKTHGFVEGYHPRQEALFKIGVALDI